MQEKTVYGGQAVIEGVMMRGTSSWAVAVRNPLGQIVLACYPLSSVVKRWRWLKWPFLRGNVVLWESLLIGIKALSYSASQAVGEEEEIKPWELALTLVIAIGLAVLLFMVLPTVIAHFTAGKFNSSLLQNIIEGFWRLAIFLAYVAAVGRLSDVKRVFQYHGAEHKVINAYEAGAPLEVRVVQSFSTFHPRCGTSFLLIVLVLSIFLFSLLGNQPELWWRVTSRLILLPVLAGLSYELLKGSARYTSAWWAKPFLTCGRWLQGLTTAEPDDQQVEVAIAALRAVMKEGDGVAGEAGGTGEKV